MKTNILFLSTILFFLSCNDNNDDNPVNPPDTSIKFKYVSAGDFHGVGIKMDGTLWNWGTNGFGQLGFPSNINQPQSYAITQLGTDNNWLNVDADQFYTVAIKNNGTIWSWGYNSKGQLGIGNYSYSAQPKQIGLDSDWKSISCGDEMAVGIKTDGSIWVWGNIVSSTPNSAFFVSRTTPLRLGIDNDWKIASVGDSFFIAIKNDGRLFSYGSNFWGELGFSSPIISELTQIGTDSDWRSCSAGSDGAGAIKNNGTLWTWGSNEHGQIGNGSVSQTSFGLTQVGIDNTWKELSAGFNNFLAIKNDGTLWCWGANTELTLGTGNNSSYYQPFKIGNSTDWMQISTGYSLTNALKSNNELWGWGNKNAMGLLSIGYISVPTKMVW